MDTTDSSSASSSSFTYDRQQLLDSEATRLSRFSHVYDDSPIAANGIRVKVHMMVGNDIQLSSDDVTVIIDKIRDKSAFHQLVYKAGEEILAYVLTFCVNTKYDVHKMSSLCRTTRSAMRGGDFYSMGMCRAFSSFVVPDGSRAVHRSAFKPRNSHETFTPTLGPPASAMTCAGHIVLCNNASPWRHENLAGFTTPCSASVLSTTPDDDELITASRLVLPELQTVVLNLRGVRVGIKWDLLSDVVKEHSTLSHLFIDHSSDSGTEIESLRNSGEADLCQIRTLTLFNREYAEYDVEDDVMSIGTKNTALVACLSVINTRLMQDFMFICQLCTPRNEQPYHPTACRLEVLRAVTRVSSMITSVLVFTEMMLVHGPYLRIVSFACGSDHAHGVDHQLSFDHERDWQRLATTLSNGAHLQVLDLSLCARTLIMRAPTLFSKAPVLRIISLSIEAVPPQSRDAWAELLAGVELLLINFKAATENSLTTVSFIVSVMKQLVTAKKNGLTKRFVCLNHSFLVDLEHSFAGVAPIAQPCVMLVPDINPAHVVLIPDIRDAASVKKHLLANMRSSEAVVGGDDDGVLDRTLGEYDSLAYLLGVVFDTWWWSSCSPDSTPLFEIEKRSAVAARLFRFYGETAVHVSNASLRNPDRLVCMACEINTVDHTACKNCTRVLCRHVARLTAGMCVPCHAAECRQSDSQTVQTVTRSTSSSSRQFFDPNGGFDELHTAYQRQRTQIAQSTTPTYRGIRLTPEQTEAERRGIRMNLPQLTAEQFEAERRGIALARGRRAGGSTVLQTRLLQPHSSSQSLTTMFNATRRLQGGMQYLHNNGPAGELSNPVVPRIVCTTCGSNVRMQCNRINCFNTACAVCYNGVCEDCRSAATRCMRCGSGQADRVCSAPGCITRVCHHCNLCPDHAVLMNVDEID